MLSESIYSNKNRPGQFRTHYVRSDSTRPIFFGDIMKEIQLTQGKVALVDDTDYEWLSKYKWYANKNYNTWYAVRNVRLPNGKRYKVLMHRVILGLEPDDNRQSDHKNHNGLANWRDNLRICTGTQNQRNQSPQKNCSSKYKGVSWDKSRCKWRTIINVNGHNVHLGLFVSEIEAAKTYDTAARKHYKEFALTNFKKG